MTISTRAVLRNQAIRMLCNAGENLWGVVVGECELVVDDQLEWSVVVYISLE